MSSVKASLKAAKSALDNQDYSSALTHAQAALSSDPKNYFAKLFLGRAHEKLKALDSAAEAYHSAAALKPDDLQAWLGLISVYEVQADKKLAEYRDAAVHAARIAAGDGDLDRAQQIVDKVVDFTKRHGSGKERKAVMKILLPDGPLWDIMEGRLMRPAITYVRLAEMVEKEESEEIARLIKERRTRLGARVGQVTVEVKREIYAKSELEELYRKVIDWTNNDEERRSYEEKLLEHANSVLEVVPIEDKSAKLDQVLDLAEGMVIINHPFQLAWDLVLETRDVDELSGLDVNMLRSYVEYFPESGLTKVLKAWLSSELSPFPPPPISEEKDKEEVDILSPEDRLLLMSEGLANSEDSPFAHRLVSEYYLHLEEYQITGETSRSGIKAVTSSSNTNGLTLQNTRDALNLSLGTALVHFESPRNHSEAKRLFTDILERKPKSTPALIGLGLIFEETEDYQDAIDFLIRALAEDPQNVRVGTELAWCRALSNDFALATKELEEWLEYLATNDPRTRDLRAQTLYRIGYCMWHADTSKAARKDRAGAYSRFIAAIKTNVNFAAAYTSLGFYYADYGKDKKRARQCFQKAFELSHAEVVAAERLARSFADKGDWDIVEVVAKRVIDSGRTRPPPGSKKKGISWPYSAMGIVQMYRQEYQQAIVSFLSALRISPDDYESYVGLGESYQNSGRYNSALRTFHHALELSKAAGSESKIETWFAEYMLANVHRELGDYDEAIEGLSNVLKERSSEFGVLISLLQTYVERGRHSIETGQYGLATLSANEAIKIAEKILPTQANAFNLWKAVGDACSLFLWIQSSCDDFPADQVIGLLRHDSSNNTYASMSEYDGTSLQSLEKETTKLHLITSAGILAYKRAIHACSQDTHAQAVAWYNLGWMEQQTYNFSKNGYDKGHLKAAVRSFKRAIELEAGNAEFWNALGVATTTLNPKVAQHSFVRSLHLNELNAKVWTNLGVLYLVQNDLELAQQAFGRSQSTDPEYAHAWVGQGLVALLGGEITEAHGHFTHAFEISSASSVIVKQKYALSSFDDLLFSPSSPKDLARLIQPIFALQQLLNQRPDDQVIQHLSALFSERGSDFSAAAEVLSQLCETTEAEYEATESPTSLARAALAKSDLARVQLASHSYAAAIENAEVALDLTSSEPDTNSAPDILSPSARQSLRLSAHLTAGLAHHHLNQTQESIAMFRAALQESSFDSDVVCALVQVLWARGGDEEKNVAKEQLFGIVEANPTHVRAVCLLAAIAALEGDGETLAAVIDDLKGLRTGESVSGAERKGIDELLGALGGLESNEERSEKGNDLLESQTAVLLDPTAAHGWHALGELSGEQAAVEMALQMTMQAVPPKGDVSAVELADAFADVGPVADAQSAIFVAPWTRSGWEALGHALEA